jgi:tRNA-specific adenosine deaminase 2
MPRAALKEGKLLRLAGARQAFRRLFPFRRGRAPGGDSEPENSGSDASGADGLNAPSVPPNTPASDYEASIVEHEEPSQQVDSDKSQNYSHFGDDDDFETDEYNDSSTMSENMAARSAGAFRQAAGREDKEMEKEDQQPGDNQVDALTEQMASTTVAAVDEKPKTQGDEDAFDMSLIDPAVLAERAEHMKFMNEALDMVSLFVSPPVVLPLLYVAN